MSLRTFLLGSPAPEYVVRKRSASLVTPIWQVVVRKTGSVVHTYGTEKAALRAVRSMNRNAA